MEKQKRVKATTIRRLPDEWIEFLIICKREGTTGTDKIRNFIIETVKNAEDKK